MNNRSGDRREMCGKTLIKSLSVQFYLGDITRVKCRCRALLSVGSGVHSRSADSKQFGEASKSRRWVDGRGREPRAQEKPHSLRGGSPH